MRYEQLKLAAIGLLLCCCLLSRLTAGDVYRGTRAGDVVVAVIEKVHSGPHTYEDPPRLELKIVEVLRGDANISRRNAVMSPPFHGVDYGPADDTDPTIRAWKKEKFKVPKVGEKWIYWGSVVPASKEVGVGDFFQLNAYHGYPYSEEKRLWAINEIQQAKQEQAEIARQKAAEIARHQRAERDWLAKFTDERIGQLGEESGYIVRAVISSGPADNFFVLEVLEWLKKTDQDTTLPKFITVQVSNQAVEILGVRRSECVVFLPEKPSRVSPLWQFDVLNDGTAIVPLDSAVLDRVKQSLR